MTDEIATRRLTLGEKLAVAEIELGDARRRLRDARARVKFLTDLHALAERAMNGALESSRSFEAMAREHFEAKERLEQIADVAQAFVDAQGSLSSGDLASDGQIARLGDLRQALSARPS